jgi:hypothetical protein
LGAVVGLPLAHEHVRSSRKDGTGREWGAGLTCDRAQSQFAHAALAVLRDSRPTHSFHPRFLSFSVLTQQASGQHMLFFFFFFFF